jgi:hypothetical protein
MYSLPSEFPADLADIGLLAAADPSCADRLIAALRLLAGPSPAQHQTPAEPSQDLEPSAVV